MLRHWKYACRAVAFLLLLAVCLSGVNRVLLPKYYVTGDWPTTSTYLDFYNLEQDTVDVLFLGSSHAAAAFSPVELYETFGIRSYNLGCEQQNLLLSYYWLQEALRFQKPKVVFLDTFMLFPYDENSALNTSEPTTRKAVDFMKWSGVKFQAVRDICRIDENQTFTSYLFPNERFHTRWKGLSENDFRVGKMSEHATMFGFFPIDFACNSEEYQPFEEDGVTEYAQMVPVMREYLDRLIELCREEGIRPVLVKTPSMFYPREAYNAVSAYAYENDIEYLDFNEEEVYHQAGLVFAQDSCDTDHVNVSGAIKVTDYIGRWLGNLVPVEQQDEQWEKAVSFYHHYRKDTCLQRETDAVSYLSKLQDENYSILIASQGDGLVRLSPKVTEGLQALGLHPERVEETGDGYLAVIDCGRVLAEESGFDTMTRCGTIRDGIVSFRITAVGASQGGTGSILLDSWETSHKNDGWNLTVYCKERKKIIDEICLTLKDGEVVIVR